MTMGSWPITHACIWGDVVPAGRGSGYGTAWVVEVEPINQEGEEMAPQREQIVPVPHEVMQYLARHLPCEFCHAKTGEPCIRRADGEKLEGTGLPVRFHVQRIAMIKVIYEHGFHKGRQSMREELNLDRIKQRHRDQRALERELSR